MGDRAVVEQVSRFAFLLRLISLLLVLSMPGDRLADPVTLVAVAFIATTSALGLYFNRALSNRVSTHPILLVLDVLVAGAVAVAFGPQSPVILYSMSTAVLIGILLKRLVAAMTLSILVSVYLLAAIAGDSDHDAMSLVLVPFTYIVVAVLAALMRRLYDDAQTEHARALRLAEDATRERERAHLAREMHDSVAKSLHGIALAAAALPRWAEDHPEAIGAKSRELQEAAETAAREARAILVDLRTETDDRTLTELLRELTDGVAAEGIPADLLVDGIGDCDRDLKRELVAIARESLDNVRRHSGARRVTVTCRGNADTITLATRDDGSGFDLARVGDGHFGVVGMRERAHTVGGMLEVDTSPGAGTTVLVRTPRKRGEPAT